jgi:hypothetical protein
MYQTEDHVQRIWRQIEMAGWQYQHTGQKTAPNEKEGIACPGHDTKPRVRCQFFVYTWPSHKSGRLHRVTCIDVQSSVKSRRVTQFRH